MWRRSAPRCELPTEQQILSELEQEQLEITKIQKQRDSILKLQESFLKKDQQMSRLSALVDKYKPYYEQCSTVRIELAERQGEVKTLSRENQLLRREFQQLLAESEELAQRVRTLETEKQALVRERHAIERVNRDIQETFKEYQATCRRRQQQHLRELQQARRQAHALQSALEEAKNGSQEQQGVTTEQVQKLQLELVEKDKELQKAKLLSQELSQQFDKSVNKICEFERQLNNYRIENHQLRKTLGLVLQQDKYQKLQEKYLKKSSPDEQEDLSEEGSEVAEQSSPELSDIKF